MRITIYLALIIVTNSCNERNATKNTSATITDTISKNNLSSRQIELKIDSLKKVTIGYNDNYEKLIKLTFDTVTEKDFLLLDQEKKYIQTSKPEQNDDFFYVKTALIKHKFKKYKDYGGQDSWSGFEYLGYYPGSKLFAITENSTSDNLGFGDFLLLDSLNDFVYNIISFGDGSVELPIPSINNKYFVYYYNSTYKHKNCDIGILKINDKSNPRTYLSEYASYNSNNFAIEKIVWETDNSFYVKGYEEVYENDKWIKKYNYYKTEFE
ncbi:hypothetical protein HNQ02_000437 [Flavobacterium sp. 7E]|uniref:hypothetical protein n=1 Tax=Flavobacterium sp. 7E TaxID=2735898 RepID=UPI00156D987D|nr:hypothetical protein [Flavobacterium sp. 7E]NRS87530.1 hypothetical protein [Flavobacterium sp. 7E]